VDPRWLLLAATANYLLPVVVFIAGVVVADIVVPGSDLAALAVGIVSMLAAGFLVRSFLRSVQRPRLRLIDLPEALESSGQRDHLTSRDI